MSSSPEVSRYSISTRDALKQTRPDLCAGGRMRLPGKVYCPTSPSRWRGAPVERDSLGTKCQPRDFCRVRPRPLTMNIQMRWTLVRNAAACTQRFYTTDTDAPSQSEMFGDFHFSLNWKFFCPDKAYGHISCPGLTPSCLQRLNKNTPMWPCLSLH